MPDLSFSHSEFLKHLASFRLCLLIAQAMLISKKNAVDRPIAGLIPPSGAAFDEISVRPLWM